MRWPTHIIPFPMVGSHWVFCTRTAWLIILLKDVRIKLSATKSVADYHSDAAILQEDIVKFNSTMEVQQKSFVLTMTENHQAIKQALCDGGSYSFALNHAHINFKEFYRIRVEEVRLVTSPFHLCQEFPRLG